jgi:ribonuclease HI
VSPSFTVEADGGSRGNPGIAAGGAVVIEDSTGELVAEIGIYVGIATNNVAEYTAMLEGLRRVFSIDPTAVVHVRMDSKLVVEQMLAAEAQSLIRGKKVTFEWIPRAQNSRADALANESMDKKLSFG